ncbi:MAG: aminoacyl-tRNA hydrolase [Treponema sp.]|nr:aminoacyl-tRNA hydrolase [Treponema sp.]
MLSLAVFLGNPGTEYARHRHNAGRLLAEKLPFYGDLAWHKKFRSRLAHTVSGGDLQSPCHFLVPETYMNLSGLSVQAAAAFHRIPPQKILVVHDELELPLGYLSLKFAGGLGGHNGLRSIKDSLGTAEFWRLRIGIGRPPGGRAPGEGGGEAKGVYAGGDGKIARWVLSSFNSDEAAILETVLKAGASLLIRAMTEDPETLLAEWKKKRVSC